MPVTVMYWAARGKSTNPGHLSIDFVTPDKRAGYISWWPGDDFTGTYMKSGDIKTSTKLLSNFAVARARPNLSLEEDMLSEMGDRTRERLEAKEYQPREGQAQWPFPDGNNQKLVWVQFPHHKVTIDGLGEELLDSDNNVINGTDGLGLNTARLWEWWETFYRAPNRTYRMISRSMNCASVVLAALNAAGAYLYTEKPLSIRTYTTPAEVFEYAKKVQAGVQKFNDSIRQVQDVANHYGREGLAKHAVQKPAASKAMTAIRSNKVMQNPGNTKTGQGGEPLLWTVEEWKKHSHVAASLSTGLARRKDQVAKIDTLLEKYHRLQWGILPQQNVTKYGLLREMLVQAHDHMRNKSTSQRGTAVLELARQIVVLADYIALKKHLKHPSWADIENFLLR